MVLPRDRSLQPIAESDEEDQTHRHLQPPPPPHDQTVVDVRDLETHLEEHQEHIARDMENHVEEHPEQCARDMEKHLEEHQEQRARDMEHHLEENQEHIARDLENQIGEQQHLVRDMEHQIETQQEHIIRNMENVENQIKNVRKHIQVAVDTHQKALDDLVNVNSLFTIATFVGLSIAQPGERSLEDRADCEPDNDMGKRLVVAEVIAFAFFLMSSLVAKSLKVHLNVYRDRDFNSFSLKIVRGIMLLLSAWGSILGCVFLTISMVEVIQIKVGRLSCGSVYAFRAVGAMIGIVLLALGIYVPFVMHAIYVSMRKTPL